MNYLLKIINSRGWESTHSHKAFRGGATPSPSLSRKTGTLPGKIVIEKPIKTEFTQSLFGENTLPLTPKILIPSLPRARSLHPFGV